MFILSQNSLVDVILFTLGFVRYEIPIADMTNS